MPKTSLEFVTMKDEEGNILGDTRVWVSEQCFTCVHLRQPPISCEAFPDGIPELISEQGEDHSVPIKGDQGIMYEKKE